jgi:predicted ABC-type ATPase
MDRTQPPRVVVLAGINGAGKTTASRALLQDVLQIPTFVNADLIARGLNSLNPESVSIAAGKVMLRTLAELVEDRADFAFETTLSGKSYARWLESLRAIGYQVFLYYYWLSSPELAIARIATRVKSGGHFVPDETVRTRYKRSVQNFTELFKPICDWWEVYDNSHGRRKLIGCGDHFTELHENETMWDQFLRSADDDTN